MSSSFDPLYISDLLDIQLLRESEIKHGRIAMLAALGFIVREGARVRFVVNFAFAVAGERTGTSRRQSEAFLARALHPTNGDFASTARKQHLHRRPSRLSRHPPLGTCLRSSCDLLNAIGTHQFTPSDLLTKPSTSRNPRTYDSCILAATKLT